MMQNLEDRTAEDDKAIEVLLKGIKGEGETQRQRGTFLTYIAAMQNNNDIGKMLYCTERTFSDSSRAQIPLSCRIVPTQSIFVQPTCMEWLLNICVVSGQPSNLLLMAVPKMD